jgi:hypothetical protein
MAHLWRDGGIWRGAFVKSVWVVGGGFGIRGGVEEGNSAKTNQMWGMRRTIPVVRLFRLEFAVTLIREYE